MFAIEATQSPIKEYSTESSGPDHREFMQSRLKRPTGFSNHRGAGARDQARVFASASGPTRRFSRIQLLNSSALMRRPLPRAI